MCSVGYNFESCNINYCQPGIKITVQQKPFSFYWRFKYHIRKEYLGYFLNGLGIYFYRAAPRPSQRSRPKHRQDVRSVSEPMTFSTRIASTTCTAQTIQRLFLPLIQVSVPFRILTFDVRIKEALVQAFDAQIAIAPRHRHGRVHFHATAGSVSTRRRGRSSSVNEQQRFRMFDRASFAGTSRARDRPRFPLSPVAYRFIVIADAETAVVHAACGLTGCGAHFCANKIFEKLNLRTRYYRHSFIECRLTISKS